MPYVTDVCWATQISELQKNSLNVQKMLFVYAAAATDNPNPLQSKQSKFISVCQESEARIEQGSAQPAPGISEPAALNMHTYE